MRDLEADPVFTSEFYRLMAALARPRLSRTIGHRTIVDVLECPWPVDLLKSGASAASPKHFIPDLIEGPNLGRKKTLHAKRCGDFASPVR
jgi:hypothetical protein